MRALLLLTLVLSLSVAFGQEKPLVVSGEPVVFNGQPVTERGFNIRLYSQFFSDSSSDINRSLAWVHTHRFYPFKPGLPYRWKEDLHRSAQRARLRFSIQNTHPADGGCQSVPGQFVVHRNYRWWPRLGRERTVELKSKSANRHESFEMQAEVMEQVDSFGESCGTEVV